MHTIQQIRNHIQQAPLAALITTRDLLCYGSRSAVDNAVHTLKKNKEIVAVCRGVFRRPERTKPVGIFEVAKVKAESFGRTIVTHAKTLAENLGLIEKDDSQHVFATGGRSSQFHFGEILIRFKGTSLRNMVLGDSNEGQVIRALCHLGKQSVTEKTVEAAIKNFTDDQRAALGSLCGSMPAWLAEFFHVFYKPSPTRISYVLLDPGESSASPRVSEQASIYKILSKLNL